MHAITPSSSTQFSQSAAEAAVPPLHTVAQVGAQPGETRPHGQAGADAANATRAVVVGPDARSLQVHYEFDRVANLWVANLLDQNGEVVRTVPATRVLHQLAELTHPRVDVHA